MRTKRVAPEGELFAPEDEGPALGDCPWCHHAWYECGCDEWDPAHRGDA